MKRGVEDVNTEKDLGRVHKRVGLFDQLSAINLP
jgi:hypothetical protein